MEFVLNNVKLKLDDKNNLYYWFDTNGGGRKLKNPYWRLKIISNHYSGYKHCRIKDKDYQFHRIVYYAHNQDWNIEYNNHDNIIDHIDRKRSNNHITNLRHATRSLNSLNQESVDNAKGYQIRRNGSFSVQFRHKNYGTYKTEEEAQQKYLDVKKEYFKLNNIII